jgi:hypothetical protein
LTAPAGFSRRGLPNISDCFRGEDDDAGQSYAGQSYGSIRMTDSDRFTRFTIVVLETVIIAYLIALPGSVLMKSDLREALARPMFGQGCNCRTFRWADIGNRHCPRCQPSHPSGVNRHQVEPS